MFLGPVHRLICLFKQSFGIRNIFSVYDPHAYGDRREAVFGVLKLIVYLIDLGFDITAVNSSGKNACDMLRTGIESYNYGKGKQGKTEKQRDLQGLKTLERLYSAYIAG